MAYTRCGRCGELRFDGKINLCANCGYRITRFGLGHGDWQHSQSNASNPIICLNVWPFSQSSSVFSQKIFGYSSMILPFVMTFTKTVIMPKAMSDSILTFFSMFWQCITTELVSFKILLNRRFTQFFEFLRSRILN